MKTRFRKIVIGIDFSDASLAGARWASKHLAPGAELLLVHVVPVPKPPIYLDEHIGQTIDQRSTLVPHLYTALRGFADLLGSDRVRVGIRTGVPWSALARVADDVKADLICVGRGNKRKGSSRFGATTPQRLLGVSRVPVLVIPQGVVAKPSRVLAALSGRAGGEQVISVAEELASSWDSRLEAIHVVEADVHRVSRTSSGGRSIGIDAFDEGTLRDLASEWAASTISIAESTVSADPIVRIGDAGQELITIAREEPGTSVVVMGRVGETLPVPPSYAQHRCGSTTRMVLWATPGPVLVLPMESAMAHTFPLEVSTTGFDAHPPLLMAAVSAQPRVSSRSWHRNGNDAA